MLGGNINLLTFPTRQGWDETPALTHIKSKAVLAPDPRSLDHASTPLTLARLTPSL